MSSTARFFGPGLLKTQVMLSLLVGALWSPLVHADDYSEVNRLVKAGQTTEALTKADQYLSAKPRDPQMRFLKGVILAETGKTNDAVATFVKLTEDYPELPEPYNNLAVLYAGQSQYDKARVALEMAIRTNPSYSTAHENLGDVYAKLASQSYSKALQLDSSNTGVPTKLALIRNLFAPDSRTSKTIPNAPVAAPSVAATATSKATPAPAASSPEKVSAPDAAPDITAAIQTWAKAWAAKDMSAYLSAYSTKFDPPGSKSRQSWEKERHDRIVTKGSISVDISDVEVKQTSATQAIATFRQAYRSGSLSSNSRKTLDMLKESGRWLITRESTGG
jgi:tetratricopeptide (TPR) repeat protein